MSDNPWAFVPPPPPPPSWYPGSGCPPPKRSQTQLVVVGVAVFAVLAGMVTLAAVLGSSGRQQTAEPADEHLVPVTAFRAVTASSPVTAAGGTAVFTDTFGNPMTGWNSGYDSDTAASNAYVGHHYRITVTKPWIVSTPSPFGGDVSQLSQSVTTTNLPSSADGSGFGLACGRDFDAPSEMDYEFFVDRDGGWYIQRRDKATDFSSSADELSEGALAQQAGRPLTIVAVCASLPDLTTTRLVLFINGVKAADLTDTSPAETSDWQGMVDTMGSDGKPVTFEVSRYAESRLGP